MIIYLFNLLLAISDRCLDLAFGFKGSNNILVFPANLVRQTTKTTVLHQKV